VLKTSDLDGQDGQADIIGNFGDTTQWLTMREDNGQDQLKDGTFPGMLLMRLGFVEYIEYDVVKTHASDWEEIDVDVHDGSIDVNKLNTTTGDTLMDMLKKRELAEQSWKLDIMNMMILPEKRHDYQARVHLYQARRLPGADSDGSIDPYFKAKLMEKDAKKNFSAQENTTDPMFYETR
jgi:hypothetical protein